MAGKPSCDELEDELKGLKGKIAEERHYQDEIQKLADIGSWEWKLEENKLHWSNQVYSIFGLDKDTFTPSVEAFEATIHPEDKEGFLKQRQTMLDEKRRACIDHRIILPDGKVRWIQERTQLILDERGEVHRVIGTVQDITDRKSIENKLNKSEERLRHLSSELFRAQECERQRFAVELHDELGQALTVLKLQLRYILKESDETCNTRAAINDSLDYIDETIERLRKLSRELRPALLDDLGLAAALNRLLDETTRHVALLGHTDFEDVRGLLMKDTEIVLFRVFQEALTNILKHAHAEKVSLKMKKEEDRVICRIEDNGLGFNVKEIMGESSGWKGIGLTAMKERLWMVGGTFTIQSRPGSGTRILFSVPCEGAGTPRKHGPGTTPGGCRCP